MKRIVAKIIAEMRRECTKVARNHYLFENARVVGSPVMFEGKHVGKITHYDKETGMARFEINKAGKQLMKKIDPLRTITFEAHY